MSPESDALYNAAIKLPEQERLDLVERLLQSMPDSELFLSLDDPDLNEKLDRRFADDEGAIDANDLLSEP